MSDPRRTPDAAPKAGVSRRHLLGATAVLGPAAAATAGSSSPAAAALVFGAEVPKTSLGVAGSVVARHRNLFRSFTLTNSSGVGIIQVGTARYLATFNAGEGVDTVQIFNADTGALHYKASTPGKAAGNFVHDGKGTLYFSSGTALLALSVTQKSLRRIGTAPAGITDFYEFQIDYKGRLWAGTYPAGVVICLDPATGAEVARTPRLGSGNDYARGLSISPDRKTVWAGTGTADPGLFRIGVDRPASPERVPVPDNGRDYILARTIARGRKVFVWHDNSAGKEVLSVYDMVSRTWGTSPTSFTGRTMSEADANGWVYVNAWGTIRRMRPSDAAMTSENVGTISETTAVNVGVAGSTVYVVTDGPSVLKAARLNTSTGVAGASVNYQVVPVPLTTQSMVIDPATNTAFAGGYRGDGLCSTNLATGVFAHSAPTAGIEQIEGMVVDSGKLYVGSYISSVIVEHRIAAGVKAADSYRTLAKLGPTYHQSRPFAWASATSHVVFGTVPDAGYRGGAMGTIERATGKVVVYNKLIPEQSIVGLEANGDTVYGTTSVRGGYGTVDWTGDAVVFAAEVRTGRLLWKRALAGVKELYGPVRIGDRLYAATLDSVVELRLSDGAPLRTFVLADRTSRPAWQSAELMLVPGTTRLVHLAWSRITVLSTATGQSSQIYADADRHLDFDRGGELWSTTANDIVKLRTEPAGTGGTPYAAPGTSPFRDVSTTQQFYKEMAWLAHRKISTGWDDGTYRPLRPINRDAMAAFLYRMAGSPAYTPPRVSPFRDVSTTQQFYKEMAWLAERKISTGWTEADGSRTYRPLQPINRDAMAAFLYRMSGSPAYTPPKVSPFRDVSTTQQFYKEMAWLADRKISTGWTEADGSRTYRPLQAINRDAMAAFLYRMVASTL